MSGFTGFWDVSVKLSKDELLYYAKLMSDQIAERGPDSHDTWCEESSGITFGHRHSSSVDLSKIDHQLMISSSGRWVISFNGKIYNILEIRKELEQKDKCSRFKSNTDTEVILEAFEFWGIESTCKRLNGMFTFSLWDKEQKKLYLVRDRLGIKPLYWGYSQGVLFFGSQPKSFIPHPKWYPEIDTHALTHYFRFNYIPVPFSIFKGIQKLTPGTILSFDNKGNQDEIRYWSLEKVVLDGLSFRSSTKHLSEELLTNELEMLLKNAVKQHMIADVPIGAFLSGGIDSSTIVALMQSQSSKPIKTFLFDFHGSPENDDEADHASKVAQYLGTDHHEIYIDDWEVKDIIPSIPSWCDEPFADPCQIPTFLVSKFARQHVAVSLSGDGGDELFAGYIRYSSGQALWEKTRNLPNFKYSSSEEFYQALITKWESPEELLLTEKKPLGYPWNNTVLKNIDQFIEKMQYIDILTYLPEYILTKVDRASMRANLETRMPFLDHRIIEFSWKLPLTMKYREGQGKWLLRQVLYRHIPKNLIDRPKMGFDLPLDQWLREPLREWAESLLNKDRLKSDGILNPTPILEKWKNHLSGKKNYQYSLWGILMFQAWKEYWKV